MEEVAHLVETHGPHWPYGTVTTLAANFGASKQTVSNYRRRACALAAAAQEVA